MKTTAFIIVLFAFWPIVWGLSMVHRDGKVEGRIECFREQVDLMRRANDMELERLKAIRARRAPAVTVEL